MKQQASPAVAGAADVMIEARGLSKFYGDFAATRDVSFSVPRGQVCAFLGPNGAGKTTFFNVLTGLYRPSTGAVTLNGREITGQTPHKIASLGLGRTFQNIRLFGLMTAAENVMVAMHSHTTSNILQIVGRTRQIGRAHV